MRAAHTSLLSHAMEVRHNSHPERTDKHMTGTLSDGTVVDAAIVDATLGRDIGPYTDREGSIERLITRRKQRLADARENLEDRLHSYIELRFVQRWIPPKTWPTSRSLINLNLLPHGQDGRSYLHQSLWLRPAFITEVCTHCFT